MDTNKPEKLKRKKSSDDIQQQILDSLEAVVPEEVYETWIKHFVFEQIDAKQIVIGYYGEAPLKKFNKEYKDEVWVHICSAVGYSKKLVIRKRRQKKPILDTAKARKNIRLARLFAVSAVFGLIALSLAVVVCSYIGNLNFRETFYSVSSIKVDSPIRIIQISDLHNCTYGKENQKLLSRVKKLAPDIILCTGDILDSGKNRQDSVAEMCTALAKIAPSYYIYGNNEVETLYDFPLTQEVMDKKFGFTGDKRDPSKLTSLKDDFERKLEKTGIKVLKNETDTITVGTTQIDVFGVLTSNPSSFWTYAGEQFESYILNNPDNLKITAIHEPFIYEEFNVEYWGDLTLCGHTHGGTMRVPVLGPLYTHEGGIFPERDGDYVYGRYDVAGRPLIVSSGLENKNIFRINNQPELVVVDINKY